MRVLHLVHQYMPERVGGTELYTRWLTGALLQRGHQVDIFYRRNAAGAGLEQRDENGARVWAAWTGDLSATQRLGATFRDPAMVTLLEQVLDETHPDLVHVEHLMGLPVALVRAIERRRLPFVVTLWDYWWVCANAQLLTNYSQEVCDGPQGYVNCARCALARVGRGGWWPAIPALALPLTWRNHLLRGVLGAAAALIAPTEFVYRWYVEHGAPAERIVTLEPGLEQPTGGVNATPRVGGPLRLAYIGGISWQKGVHVLVEAVAGLAGQGELWIAGDETFDPQYVAGLRARSGVAVRFLGRLERSAVWEMLAQVDVVVVPTLWYETFSFIISEAFAAGLPVVASRLGPLADRVRDGVDGLLLPPGDTAAWRAAFERLVGEAGLVERLRAAVRPPVTLDEHAGQVEALYGRVVRQF